MLLSVLVPAYEEASTIGEVLVRVLAVDVASVGVEMEVIVCDDGSADGTGAVVRDLRRKDDRLRLVVHPQNRGKGAAVRTALGEARGDYIIIQDADVEYRPEDYLALLQEASAGAQVVYGSRFMRRAYPANMALPNFLCNKLLTFMANTLYGMHISDEATCYKLFRADVLRAIAPESDGFDFCPEVTAKLGLMGVQVREVPVDYVGRSKHEGKKIRWTDGVRAMWVLCSLRFGGLPKRSEGTFPKAAQARIRP